MIGWYCQNYELNIFLDFVWDFDALLFPVS